MREPPAASDAESRRRAGTDLSLTLVVPCYREAVRLQPDRFVEFLENSQNTRLLFVDDGSPDETLRVLTVLAARQPARIAVLELPQNMGKGEAVRRGLIQAMKSGSDLVGFWDADLASPIELAEEFRALFHLRPTIRWVLGSRWRGLGWDIQRKAVRHYLGRVFATAVSLQLGLPVYDTQCGAKLFRADGVLEQVLSRPFLSRWIFDVEMLARLIDAHSEGLAPAPEAMVHELPLRTWHDIGASHLRMGDFLRAAVDLWRIRRRRH